MVSLYNLEEANSNDGGHVLKIWREALGHRQWGILNTLNFLECFPLCVVASGNVHLRAEEKRFIHIVM